MRSLLSSSLVALLLGCGDGGAQGADRDAGAAGSGAKASDGFAFHADAGPEGPLSLGRCVLQGDGSDCTGAEGEAHEFVALAGGDGMRIVLGPQGSFMLVFLLRAEGIDGGDVDLPASADNPTVEVQMRSATDDAIVTRFRGRVAFAARPGEKDAFETHSEIFFVVDGQEQALIGQTVVIEAVLQDRDGQRRRGLVHVLVEKG